MDSFLFSGGLILSVRLLKPAKNPHQMKFPLPIPKQPGSDAELGKNSLAGQDRSQKLYAAHYCQMSNCSRFAACCTKQCEGGCEPCASPAGRRLQQTLLYALPLWRVENHLRRRFVHFELIIDLLDL
jgi:hypothetical protein